MPTDSPSVDVDEVHREVRREVHGEVHRDHLGSPKAARLSTQRNAGPAA